MTRKIVDALRLKGQNLDSAFSIFDSDSDGFITYQEFKDAVIRTFRIRIDNDELFMYWDRLRPENNKISAETFYHKFGQYLSDDPKMRMAYQQGHVGQGDYKKELSHINQKLYRNTETLESRLLNNMNKNAYDPDRLNSRDQGRWPKGYDRGREIRTGET